MAVVLRAPAAALVVLVRLGVSTLAEHRVPTGHEGFAAFLRQDFPVPQDFVGAVKWFRKAAAQDDTDAQLNAVCTGMAKPYRETWYRKPTR